MIATLSQNIISQKFVPLKEKKLNKEENGSYYRGSQSNVVSPPYDEVDEKKNGHGGENKCYHIGSGIKSDLAGRLPYYVSDFTDGITGKNTLQKLVSTTLFLYFRYLP